MASSQPQKYRTRISSEWPPETLALNQGMPGMATEQANWSQNRFGDRPSNDGAWAFPSSSSVNEVNSSRSVRPFSNSQSLSQPSPISPDLVPGHKLPAHQYTMPDQRRPQSYWNANLRSPMIQAQQQSSSGFAQGNTSSPRRAHQSHSSHLSASLFPAQTQGGISPPNQHWLGSPAWQGSSSTTSSNDHSTVRRQAYVHDSNQQRHHQHSHTNSQDLGYPRSSPYIQQLQLAYQQGQQQRQQQQQQQEQINYQSQYQPPTPPQLFIQQPRSRGHQTRRPANRDDVSGHHYYFPKTPRSDEPTEPSESSLPQLPTSLTSQEQQQILHQVHARLCRCAYDFVAYYEFAIPFDPLPENNPYRQPHQEDPRRPPGLSTSSSPTTRDHYAPIVSQPEDRSWSWWAHLLKRLATKRRIPARVLYGAQIGSMVSVLESSLIGSNDLQHQHQQQQGFQGEGYPGEQGDAARPPPPLASLLLRDDRNVLQIVSAGLQVAKLLKDAGAMRDLEAVYQFTEEEILRRRR